MAENQILWNTGRVVSNETAADGIAKIVIRSEHSHRAAPGTHIDVRIDDGDIRSYSVVSASADGHTLTLGVRLSPTSRGGSRYMHSLRPGDQIELTAPLQNFPLRIGAERYVLVAGGIGITAMAAMAAVLRRLDADYRLVYVGRSRSGMAFLSELVAVHGERIEVHVDDEGTGLDIGELIESVAVGTELYMCGPIRLMDAIRRSWIGRGLPEPNLRYETFGNSGWFQAEEFTVRAPALGIETIVRAEESVLDALERAGADIMYDCRKGECGLCQVTVVGVDGTVDHRDVFFSDKQKSESAKLCACVSRVVSSNGCRATLTLEV